MPQQAFSLLSLVQRGKNFMRDGLWISCGAALVIAGIAVLGDRRRNRRSDPDDVGFMPWPLVLVLSLIIAGLLAALALKAAA
jgi:hypothetical protein